MVIILTYLPFVGFGQYYKNGVCIRVRDATELKDIIYAYLFFVLGKYFLLSRMQKLNNYA